VRRQLALMKVQSEDERVQFEQTAGKIFANLPWAAVILPWPLFYVSWLVYPYLRLIEFIVQKKGWRSMQSVIQVTCYRGGSLREAIANDGRLEKYQLAVFRQKTSGRNPGWGKLHSTQPNVLGAINLEWDPATKTLMARIVTKGKNTADRITGDFVAYLMRCQRRRIRSILLLPGLS